VALYFPTKFVKKNLPNSSVGISEQFQAHISVSFFMDDLKELAKMQLL